MFSSATVHVLLLPVLWYLSPGIPGYHPDARPNPS